MYTVKKTQKELCVAQTEKKTDGSGLDLFAAAKQTIITHLKSKQALDEETFMQLAAIGAMHLSKAHAGIKKNYCALLVYAKKHAPQRFDRTLYLGLEAEFRAVCKPLLQEEAAFKDEYKQIEAEVENELKPAFKA